MTALRRWRQHTWITRAVVGIVLATFFSDVGHEMVTAVLPLYLATIGLGPAALGVMEGLADLVFSLSKLGGGLVGHHSARKRPWVTLGYCTTTLGTGAIALTHSLAALVTLRTVAWCGRGFRSPLRDFLLADEVGPTHFGRAYGIERSADMRYGEQIFEVSVPLDDIDIAGPDIVARMAEAFHRRHEQLYTYCLRDQEAVLVNARIAAVGELPALPEEPSIAARRAMPP